MENKIKFEDIQRANESIKTTDIKGKDYAEVNQRIKAFRMVYPTGTITTDIVSLENGIVTMRATVKDESEKIIGTGYAQEKESSSFINKTSYIENCETSAVGRALGMCGFGIDTSVASYEEVANAIENQNNSKPKKEEVSSEVKALATEVQGYLKTYNEQYEKIVRASLGKEKVKKLTELPLVELKGLVELGRNSANSFRKE